MIYKFSNILTFALGLLVSLQALAQANTTEHLLQRADSLFESKKYTEALVEYQQLYKDQKASPSMLLKMAFIHEGLDQTVEALYYLNQYYELSADREVIQKISSLAETNELQGYRYTDADYILNFLNRYRIQFLSAMAALLMLTSIISWKRNQKNESLIPSFVFQVLLVIILFVFNNDILSDQQAIIKSNNTVLMNGPGAGAEPITVIKMGHKVTVLDRDEIWTKINWNDHVGFVRNNRILPI
jgi:hypothetical protein